MSVISATRTIDVPRKVVWDVLADFANIANWTSQVQKSYAIGEPVTGVGQGRHCDLAPAGAIDETITEYIPEHRLEIFVHNTKKLPIKSSLTAFVLESNGQEATTVTMTANPTFKGGPIGAVLKQLVKGKLRNGLAELLDDLAAAAGAKANAAA